jgi:predicted acyl esterase
LWTFLNSSFSTLTSKDRDAYWCHGSVCEQPAAVACPVLAVGGFADGYSDAVFRMLGTLPACAGLLGPWGHDWPDTAQPGPQIGYLQVRLLCHVFDVIAIQRA